jgi:DNA polymerase-3 subunit beta
MRFRVEHELFARAVARAARVAPERPDGPSRGGLRIEAANGRVRICAGDHEVSVSAELRAETPEHGLALVPGHRFAQVVGALAAPHLQVELAGGRLELCAGAARFCLLTLPPRDCPELPVLPPVTGTADAGELRRAVGQVVAAASRERTAPVLGGVRLEIAADRLTLAALDRYRCAVRTLEWRPEWAAPTTVALAPARALAEAVDALPAEHRIGLVLTERGGDRLLGLRCPSGRATVRLLTGEIPRYDSLFPAEFASVAVAEREPLTRALRRVALVTESRSPVRLGVSAGSIRLDGGSVAEDIACEPVEAKLDGPAIEIAFDPRLLLDGLTAITEPVVELALTTATGKAVLRGRADLDAEPDDAFRYLLMPVRLSS